VLVDPAQESILALEERETWRIPGLQRPVHVVRTELNIPHIYAASEEDLWRVQGFVQARDRWFQFELARRLAQGRVAELLGPLGLEIDLQSVGQGTRFVTRRLADRLDDRQRRQFEAFAAGINAWIEEARAGRLPAPSELETLAPLLGAENPTDIMEPVALIDVVAFVGFLVFQLGFETTDLLREAVRQSVPELYEAEAPLASLRTAGALRDIVEYVAPAVAVASADFAPAASSRSLPAPGTGPAARPSVVSAPALRLDAAWRSRLVERHERSQRWLRRGPTRDHGSNTWAANNLLTGGNGTLLAGDGHLSLGVAPFFYQMGRHLAPFGDGSIDEVGLYFPGAPVMGVGTNGRVAWSQTYLYGDITDYYALPVGLNSAGEPATWEGDGTQPLTRIEETYEVAAVLGAGGTQTWARWETAEGLWLADIEGDRLDSARDPSPGPGRAVVTMQGDWIVPRDVDGDGVVTGIFFDYVGFDIGDTYGAVERFGQADDVQSFLDATEGLVAYAGNFVVADRSGNIAYTGYNATPCRRALGLPSDGTPWDAALDPRYVIRGDWRGFRIPLREDGTIDDTRQDSPTECVVPRSQWPTRVNPASGFVLNANNDPAGGTFDNSLFNDPWYLGIGFSTGFRASSIERRLAQLAIDQDATLDSMSALQGDVRSRMGEVFVPHILDALNAARSAGEDTALGARYRLQPARLDEVQDRLQAWAEGGLPARSGVSTFYQVQTDADRRDAVATMIFNEWLRRFNRVVLDDEGIDLVFSPSPNELRLLLLQRMLELRGPAGEEALGSWNPETGESVFFDILDTPEVETSREMVVQAMLDALDALSSRGRTPDTGGFGTEDMDQWLWGLRHQVRFRSVLVEFAGDNAAVGLIAGAFSIDTERLPLAPELPSGDPRAGLTWFPRHGDLFAVDAPNYLLTGDDYFYSSGPVMRMVISLTPQGVTGRNILPGGQSGLIESPHFADQAELWLGNRTVPMRLTVDQVVAGATHRETFTAP
jgi:penicillin amidase